MIPKSFAAALLLIPIGFVHGAPPGAEPMVGLSSKAEKLKERFRLLVGPGGQSLTSVEAASLPPQEEIELFVELYRAHPLANDGYSYWLVVHRSNLGYILRSGGIDGAQKIFGPFPVDE